MIGYFPTLYPDELLYSWFARYHEHIGNISPKHTMSDLYKTISSVAVLDIPSNINAIYKNISHFQPPDIKELIENHTLFKYYTYFQSQNVQSSVYEYMLHGSESSFVHLLLGIVASNIKQWEYIRYCPSCIREDKEKYGEPFWHVSHQLPKTYYCLKHGIMLENSMIKLRDKSKHMYYSASSISKSSNVSKASPNFNSVTEKHLKQITFENNNLLQIKFVDINVSISKIIRKLLNKHGYIKRNGYINQRKFALDFIDFYGHELLRLMNCSIQIERQTCWLKTITRKHRKSFHPIQYILVLNFFNISVSDLENYTLIDKGPFGEGPFPCLNNAAEHFNSYTISDVNLSYCYDSGRPIGTFICECGFIYTRKGPDTCEANKFTKSKIKAFGHVWMEKLRDLIEKEKLSYSETARILKCDVATVKKYINPTVSEPKNNIDLYKNELKKSKEIEWLNLIMNNPSCSIKQLREKNSALYTWHYRYNRDFLNSNKPNLCLPRQMNNRVDWVLRDIELLDEVKEAIKKLRCSDNPVFINIASIAKYTKNPSYIEKYLSKLPKTNAYLLSHIETREQFQLRRLLFNYNTIIENGEEISVWKLRKICGFRKTMSRDIEEIMVKIQNGEYNKNSSVLPDPF